MLGDLIYVDEKSLNELGNTEMDDKSHETLWDLSMLAKDVIKFGGSVWLVQQDPWIQNKTIRDNILFGCSFNKERYNRVIETWQLSEDLEIIYGGDLAEIGERGINLSGGQKARISLARAIYSEWDIVLMDDPLSALDSNVKQKIFREVFWGELKHKTRILVTHAIELLHLADRVAIMEKGEIKFVGILEEFESNEYKNKVFHLSESNIHIYNEVDVLLTEESEIAMSQSNKNILNESFRIISDENSEVMETGFEIYAHFIFSNWNWISYLIVVLFLIWGFYFGVYSTYYFGVWIKSSQDISVFWTNFTLAISHSIFFILSINTATLLVYFSTIRVSRILNERMINSLINAPINTYFDKISSGNILNKFSRDLNKIDWEIYK